jgi:hypothetical protein
VDSGAATGLLSSLHTGNHVPYKHFDTESREWNLSNSQARVKELATHQQLSVQDPLAVPSGRGLSDTLLLAEVLSTARRDMYRDLGDDCLKKFDNTNRH